MRSYYDVDAAVCDSVEQGDFESARRCVFDDEGVLSRKDKERLLGYIESAKARQSTPLPAA